MSCTTSHAPALSDGGREGNRVLRVGETPSAGARVRPPVKAGARGRIGGEILADRPARNTGGLSRSACGARAHEARRAVRVWRTGLRASTAASDGDGAGCCGERGRRARTLGRAFRPRRGRQARAGATVQAAPPDTPILSRLSAASGGRLPRLGASARYLANSATSASGWVNWGRMPAPGISTVRSPSTPSHTGSRRPGSSVEMATVQRPRATANGGGVQPLA